MPVLEHLDVIVVDERPYEITPAGGAPRCIYSFGVRAGVGDALADPGAQARVSELFLGVWAGEIENDGLNRLVLRGGLSRAPGRRAAGAGEVPAPGRAAVHRGLVRRRARGATRVRRGCIVELFEARFDLALSDPERATRVDGIVRRARRATIDAVTSLDEDRILRALRRGGAGGGAHEHVPRKTVVALSIKFDPSLLDVPARAAAAARDLGVLAARRSRAPARW